MEQSKLLNVKQVANYLSVSISTIDRMQKDGEIPPADYLVSNVQKRLWKMETITGWLNTQCRNPKAEKEQIA